MIGRNSRDIEAAVREANAPTHTAWSIDARVTIEPKYDHPGHTTIVFEDATNVRYPPHWDSTRCVVDFLRDMANQIERGDLGAGRLGGDGT